MEHLKSALETISLGIDLVGIGILCIGFIKGLVLYIKSEFPQQEGKSGIMLIQELRCKVGLYILMALDFLIASDIINSTVHTELHELHELHELYELGVIVVLRTAIGYFLGKEIQEIQEIQAETGETQSTIRV